MASVKNYPSLAPDLDPAQADVPVGGYVCSKQPIRFHEDLPVTTLKVRNTGDRPVQVGSHFHFFEVNRGLQFDREAAFGLHLHIPASTALRFEPGDEREVKLVPFRGQQGIYGFNNLVDGPVGGKNAAAARARAMTRAAKRGFVAAPARAAAPAKPAKAAKAAKPASKSKKTARR